MAYKHVYADVCTIVNEQEAANRQWSVVPLSAAASLLAYSFELRCEHIHGTAFCSELSVVS